MDIIYFCLIFVIFSLCVIRDVESYGYILFSNELSFYHEISLTYGIALVLMFSLPDTSMSFLASIFISIRFQLF